MTTPAGMGTYVEKIRLGTTTQRADGQTESRHNVYEAAHRRPERPGLWGRILASAGATTPPQPEAPPRQPGRVWHGFSAEGGPITEVVLARDGRPVWSLCFSPPTASISHRRPFGVNWALDLLGYYDVSLTFVHAPGSTVTVRETWSS